MLAKEEGHEEVAGDFNEETTRMRDAGSLTSPMKKEAEDKKEFKANVNCTMQP